jgi:hypothetical protein
MELPRLTEAGRYRDTESTETESDKFLFWGMLLATRDALWIERGILQVECYRTRYVPVNIILRVIENADFNVDAVAKIPNLGLRRAARNPGARSRAGGAFIPELRCKLGQTECKKKDPDVKSTLGHPAPGFSFGSRKSV